MWLGFVAEAVTRRITRSSDCGDGGAWCSQQLAGLPRLQVVAVGGAHDAVRRRVHEERVEVSVDAGRGEPRVAPMEVDVEPRASGSVTRGCVSTTAGSGLKSKKSPVIVDLTRSVNVSAADAEVADL